MLHRVNYLYVSYFMSYVAWYFKKFFLKIQVSRGCTSKKTEERFHIVIVIKIKGEETLHLPELLVTNSHS